jgi:hypothetical protein
LALPAGQSNTAFFDFQIIACWIAFYEIVRPRELADFQQMLIVIFIVAQLDILSDCAGESPGFL